MPRPVEPNVLTHLKPIRYRRSFVDISASYSGGWDFNSRPETEHTDITL
jgi:hypothetical protein